MENLGALQIIIGIGSLIAITPFVMRFIPAIFHFLICKIQPIQKVTIQHKHDGEIIKSITIDLKSSTPLVTQIALAAKKSGGTNNG
ncbi:hypothetical protein QVN42_13460 [Yersinia nurmii]|uniref:Uncharacterized protein n=1 Tax=Yersinia nurmii TaxID=685706 RepID=A0AAW7JZC1_9GAMM|nr:hypothetical protein [Yersinia nurmii]MDN0088372.1 hypothetical protein [Yersinia nurmii]